MNFDDPWFGSMDFENSPSDLNDREFIDANTIVRSLFPLAKQIIYLFDYILFIILE